jgi:hypothetical protein
MWSYFSLPLKSNVFYIHRCVESIGTVQDFHQAFKLVFTGKPSPRLVIVAHEAHQVFNRNSIFHNVLKVFTNYKFATIWLLKFDYSLQAITFVGRHFV